MCFTGTIQSAYVRGDLLPPLRYLLLPILRSLFLVSYLTTVILRTADRLPAVRRTR